MSENKKQSIINKINDMKQKKIHNERERLLNKIKDIIDRSKDKSKLKIKWSNKDYTKNKTLWIMNTGMKSFSIFNGNEDVLLMNSNFKLIVEKIDEEFVDFWDSSEDIDLENINISIEFYEDVGNDDVVILKRNVVCENHNIINFGMISGILECESDSDCDGEEMKCLGNTKQLLINQYIKSLVKLEKLKLRDSEVYEKCMCDDCVKNLKKITIEYSGVENRDIFRDCSEDIDLEVRKQEKDILMK